MEGLTYVENFITNEEERELLEHIDRGQWLFDLKRRVQHYGYKYDYKNRSINRSMQLGALPDFLNELIDRLMARHVLSKRPDQVIINEYLPGQGISAHVDKPSLFDNEIASISLGSTCVMEFKHKATKTTHPVLLGRRSLVLMKGAARYEWTHCIPARKKDKVDGRQIPRQRRVSLTFRKVILGDD